MCIYGRDPSSFKKFGNKWWSAVYKIIIVIKLSVEKLESEIRPFVGGVVLDLDHGPAPRNGSARDID